MSNTTTRIRDLRKQVEALSRLMKSFDPAAGLTLTLQQGKHAVSFSTGQPLGNLLLDAERLLQSTLTENVSLARVEIRELQKVIDND